MRKFLTLLALTVLPVSAHADRPVVIELFTSQGCSSCPPADALLGDLAGRDDVIALAFHVDYWDYIGWKDQFADPIFTKRQRAYGRAFEASTIYTPQMVFNGMDDVVGSRQSQVLSALKQHQNRPELVDLSAAFQGNNINIMLSNAQASGRYDVILVEYQPSAMTTIKRGENAGRTLRYHNIVRHIERLGRWNGRDGKTLRAKRSTDGPAVILIQEQNNGEIIAATHVN